MARTLEPVVTTESIVEARSKHLSEAYTLNDEITSSPNRKKGLAATGGVVGAVLASSCCIGPLVAISLGASGPWIGKLTALKTYQPLFVALTVVLLGYGFWRVYGPQKKSCDDNSCASATSDRVVKVALWAATILVVLSLTTDFWAPIFY